MKGDLEKLIELAKTQKVSEEECEEQRRSFAFGNANFENEHVTREMVDTAAETLKNGRQKDR